MEKENDNFLFCTDCQMVYSNLSSFKKHVQKRHPTKVQQILPSKKTEHIPKLSCESCEQCFNSSRGLTIHKKSCIPDAVETKHSAKTIGKTKLKRSIIEDETIACSDCELEFEDLATFKQHMRDHRDNCIKKIKKTKNGSLSKQPSKTDKRKRRKSSDDLKNVKEEVNSTKEVVPSEEDKSPVRKSNRNTKRVSYAHLIQSDSDSENETLASKITVKWGKSSKTHVCNECHAEYKKFDDLQKHIRKHHPSKVDKSTKPKTSWRKLKLVDKKYNCEECSTKYNNISSFRKHLRKYHPAKWLVLAPKLYKKRFKNSEKIYSCTECQTIYGNIIGLRKHIRKYHESKLNELAPALYKKKPKNTEKTLSCGECQVKYCTLISLRKHIKKQHPSKFPELIPLLYKKNFGNFKRDISCSECDMKYSNMSGLRKHIRKHHPNKLVELAPLLYTFKRNMAKNILMKRSLKEFNGDELIDLDKYKCKVCESSYSNISNLRKHLRKFHPEKLSDVAPLLKDNTNFKYPCDLCTKKFNCIRNFKYHQRKCHPEVAQPVKRTTKPSKINKCPLCHFENTERKKLLQHFKEEHDIEVKMNPVEVTTLEEFSNWKDSFEKETNTRFVKEYHFSCSSHDVVSYICHRSGYYNPKGKGLRHMKAQGSSKINAYCPAAMKLKKLKDGTVKVTFCGIHIGHTTDVSHLHLTPVERQIIAEKIAMNIPFNEILESIKDSVSESDFKRIHMLSKKDLYNIKSSFHLTSPVAKSIKPPSENISFEVWIEDMKKDGDCIMFHKPQGDFLPEHPNLKPDDFVLMIMNQTQRDKLKKFGHDTVCLDRSFDLNSHQFELTSLLVLSETEEGFPCAFLVSNRSDQEIMTLFFHYIKTYVGGISAKIFMSDMVDYFYTAWISIMPQSQLRLFCTWQVEHAWRKRLSSMKSKEKQENILTKLKIVLEEKQISSFKVMLESVAEQLGAETHTWDFSNYLLENYLQKPELWPSSIGAYKDIRFNSHLERMHKTLKHLFLNGKNAKHFGKALGDIMRFMKDKLFDRTILINRGKINNKMKIAIFRHKLSLHSKTDNISKTDEGWQIPSSETAEIHTINEIQPSCRCEFICPECKSCIHRYLCSCLDSTVKWNMCKHIHLLCRYLNSPEYAKQQPQQDEYAKSQPQPQKEYAKQQVVYVKQPTQVEYVKQQTQVEYVKQPPQVEYVKQPTQVEYVKQPPQVEYVKQPPQVEYVKQPTQVEYVKQPTQVEYVKQPTQVEYVKQPTQVEYIKRPTQVEYVKRSTQVEFIKQQPQQVEFIKHQPQQVEYIKQLPQQVEFVKDQTQQVEYVKQQNQRTDHVQVQHIQLENHVGHVDHQVESTYIYCNETNQREMDAILAEVNICNLETVQVTQVTQIPTSCTIQIPTSCTVVPQVAQITTNCPSSFGEVIDTKESLKMKFLKLLEEASSPTELEVVQKMLASITPTLEVIKGSTTNHQVLFPL